MSLLLKFLIVRVLTRNLKISSRELPNLLENAVIVDVANRIGKSPAQVLLRYLLELGVSVIPKSTNAGRLRSNIDLFDFTLSAEDKALIAALDANVRVVDFKFFAGIEKHPEFPFNA